MTTTTTSHHNNWKRPIQGICQKRIIRNRRKGGRVVQKGDIYIGRRMTMGGWKILKDSPFANPFKVTRGGSGGGGSSSVHEVCTKFAESLASKPKLISQLRKALTTPDEKEEKKEEKTLGCWCDVSKCKDCIAKDKKAGTYSNSKKNKAKYAACTEHWRCHGEVFLAALAATTSESSSSPSSSAPSL
jgi:hypothetical protein